MTSEARKVLDRVAGPVTLGSCLRAVREDETMEAFARRLGITRSHLCDIEHGRRLVPLKRAAEWAKMLGYSEKQFVRLALEALLRRSGLKYGVQLVASVD